MNKPLNLISDYTDEILYLRACAAVTESPTLKFKLATLADDIEYAVRKAKKVLAEIGSEIGRDKKAWAEIEKALEKARAV